MSTLWNSWGSTFLVALLAGFSLSAEFASAQDVQASILVETGGQPSMSMDYRANARGVRVDITQSQPLSIIWMQGPPPKILLLQQYGRMRLLFQTHPLKRDHMGQLQQESLKI